MIKWHRAVCTHCANATFLVWILYYNYVRYNHGGVCGERHTRWTSLYYPVWPRRHPAALIPPRPPPLLLQLQPERTLSIPARLCHWTSATGVPFALEPLAPSPHSALGPVTLSLRPPDSRTENFHPPNSGILPCTSLPLFSLSHFDCLHIFFVSFFIFCYYCY